MTVVYLLTSCKKVGPIQQTLNIISHLDRKKFTPILVTLYKEPSDETSQLHRFLDLDVVHYFVPTSKSDILMGRLSNLKALLDFLSPKVIHSLGVFPDYVTMRLGYSDRQLITLRNYMKEDYCSKFGRLQGELLRWLQISAVRKAKKVVTCSKSLMEIYRERERLNFDYIRNGVDVSSYHRVSTEEKMRIRRNLGLPADKKILVYSGSLIPRKNQQFLLEVFMAECLSDCFLVLLGGGISLPILKQKYGHLTNVDIRGEVNNVDEYLQASDIYISSSLSEGMPNGVLEAMATGLPVILSDIRQHREIFDANPKIGELFDLTDKNDCLDKIMKLLGSNLSAIGKEAEYCAKNDFNAKKTSAAYQKMYENMM